MSLVLAVLLDLLGVVTKLLPPFQRKPPLVVADNFSFAAKGPDPFINELPKLASVKLFQLIHEILLAPRLHRSNECWRSHCAKPGETRWISE